MPDRSPAAVPEHEVRAVRQYVEGQYRNEDDPDDPDYKVTLVQKVASRRLMGTDYDIYDVHLPTSRWWVITEGTNLYSQQDFPDFENAFTFHVGLMMRMMGRDAPDFRDEEAAELGSAWRRYEAGVAALDTAREAEDYQAVGIMCREAFIAFAREHANADWLVTPVVRPATADFKNWTDLFAQALAVGRTRRYLKELAAKAWDMAVSLQHNSDATVWDAEIMLSATSHLLDVYVTAIVKVQRKPPERCPRCESYRFSMDGDYASRGRERGWLAWQVCPACGYKGPESFESWRDFDARIARAAEEPLAVEPPV
jgi:hypothetical protein